MIQFEMLTSFGPFFAMDEFVTFPAHGFQVLNTVRTAVGSVLGMMNLQATAGAAPCTAPAMLLHRLAAVNEVDTVHQSPERDEIGAPYGFND